MGNEKSLPHSKHIHPPSGFNPIFEDPHTSQTKFIEPAPILWGLGLGWSFSGCLTNFGWFL